MAYTPATLTGNINASAVGASLFGYGTLDTRADVVAPGYFDTEDTSFLVLTQGDIITAECSDGYAVYLVTASTPTGVAVKQTITEA